MNMPRMMKIYAGSVQATPFTPQPTYTPPRLYPYVAEKIRYELSPKVVAVESPYKNWPRMTLSHGITV